MSAAVYSWNLTNFLPLHLWSNILKIFNFLPPPHGKICFSLHFCFKIFQKFGKKWKDLLRGDLSAIPPLRTTYPRIYTYGDECKADLEVPEFFFSSLCKECEANLGIVFFLRIMVFARESNQNSTHPTFSLPICARSAKLILIDEKKICVFICARSAKQIWRCLVFFSVVCERSAKLI